MYDLAIIGGGPAGYDAAGLAGGKGLKVVLFEKKDLGGVCLNEGCIPTKTLLYSAKLYDSAKNGAKYGVVTGDVSFDYDKVMKRKQKVVAKLVGGVGAKMKAHKVEVVKDYAVIQGKSGDDFLITSGGKEYKVKNIMVSTGSEAAVPPIPGLSLENKNVVTNREILQLSEAPKELVVIGGGVIGTEFASFFNSVGSKVTVIEMMDKIIGPMDREMSSLLQKEYEKKGVVFHLQSKVVEVKGNEVIFEAKDGSKQSVSGDAILVSVGRNRIP